MRFLLWLRRPDVLGVPGWLYLLLGVSWAVAGLCLLAPAVGILAR